MKEDMSSARAETMSAHPEHNGQTAALRGNKKERLYIRPSSVPSGITVCSESANYALHGRARPVGQHTTQEAVHLSGRRCLFNGATTARLMRSRQQ